LTKQAAGGAFGGGDKRQPHLVSGSLVSFGVSPCAEEAMGYYYEPEPQPQY
jgi:hypothetical protein